MDRVDSSVPYGFFQARATVERYKSWWLGRLVLHDWFERFCSAVIGMNCLLLGYCAHFSVQRVMDDHDTLRLHWMNVAETLFQIYYLTELILKLMVHRMYFFIGHDCLWNYLDSALAAAACYDLLTGLVLQHDNSSNNFMILRIVRLIKVAKVLRIVRLFRFFRELRLVLQSIIASLRSLFWSAVLLALSIYVITLIILQGIIEFSDEKDRTAVQSARHRWGGLHIAMDSIYKAITGGCDWEEVSDPLSPVSNWLYYFFLAAIGFLVLSVLNILIGIFVEKAIECSNLDRDNLVFEAAKDANNQSDLLKAMFFEMDEDDSGSISWEEFKAHYEDDSLDGSISRCRAYMDALDIDVRDARFFFETLSEACGGEDVDIEAFVEGCVRMKGGPRMVDMYILSSQSKLVYKEMERLEGLCLEQFQALRQELCVGSDKIVPIVRLPSGQKVI